MEDHQALDESLPAEIRELIERLYRIHWRLRLRNPTTPVERQEWAELKRDLRKLYEGSDHFVLQDSEGRFYVD